MKLSDIRSLNDPMVPYRFDCIMPSDILIPPSKVMDMDLPTPNVTQESKFKYGSQVFYAGFKSMSSFGITFYEDEFNTTTRILETWRDLVVDEENNYGYENEYKKTIKVALKDGRGKISTIVELRGVFPTTRSPLSLTSGSVQKLSCDH